MQEVALAEKDRRHARHQKHRHGDIELAQRTVLFQQPSDQRAKQAPGACRAEACQYEDGNHDRQVGHDVLDARAVGDDGACEKRHALWIDHLKGGGLHEGQRPARFVAVGPAGGADPPGQIAEEQDGRTLHQQMKLRDGGKKPGEAEAAGNGQATDARGDPQNMRKRTSESECRAGRGQHDVVRPWRERRCGSEDHKP